MNLTLVASSSIGVTDALKCYISWVEQGKLFCVKISRFSQVMARTVKISGSQQLPPIPTESIPVSCGRTDSHCFDLYWYRWGLGGQKAGRQFIWREQGQSLQSWMIFWRYGDETEEKVEKF